MKETEKQKRIKEELKLLNIHVKRLTEEILSGTAETIVFTELNLCLESIMNLKKEYDYLENRVEMY